jgi:hypothetical protein
VFLRQDHRPPIGFLEVRLSLRSARSNKEEEIMPIVFRQFAVPINRDRGTWFSEHHITFPARSS